MGIKRSRRRLRLPGSPQLFGHLLDLALMDLFFLEGVFGFVKQFIHVHGFHQVVKGSHFHAFDSHFHAGVAGEHDHFGQWKVFFDCTPNSVFNTTILNGIYSYTTDKALKPREACLRKCHENNIVTDALIVGKTYETRDIYYRYETREEDFVTYYKYETREFSESGTYYRYKKRERWGGDLVATEEMFWTTNKDDWKKGIHAVKKLSKNKNIGILDTFQYTDELIKKIK